jgi:hypothetical protein
VPAMPGPGLPFDRSEGDIGMADEEIDRHASDDTPPEWLSDSPDGDPAGFSLLRAIAEDPDAGLIELASGVWYQPKLRPDRDKLS